MEPLTTPTAAAQPHAHAHTHTNNAPAHTVSTLIADTGRNAYSNAHSHTQRPQKSHSTHQNGLHFQMPELSEQQNTLYTSSCSGKYVVSIMSVMISFFSPLEVKEGAGGSVLV